MSSYVDPFMSKNGVDIYENSNWTYWLLNIFLWIYALLVIFWVVLLLLVNVPHTYFWNLLQPGTLFSMRYRSILSVILILSALRSFVPVISRALLRFRKSRECSIAWFTMLGLITIVDIVVFGFMISQYGGANQPGDYFNICNAVEYCCVFYMDANCQNTSPCSNPTILQSELARNGLCNAMFFTSIPFVILSIVLFMWPFMLWYLPTDMNIDPDDKDDNEYNIRERNRFQYNKQTTPQFTSAMPHKNHQLRHRTSGFIATPRITLQNQ